MASGGFKMGALIIHVGNMFVPKPMKKEKL
jgi:hypothetical protein